MTVTGSRWPGDAETKPAPGLLGRIQALVNTVELPDGADRLAEPADAAPWLRDNGLLVRGDGLTSEDLELIRGVREAFRAMLIHNGGGPAPTAAALAPLETVAANSRAHVVLDDGTVRLAAETDSVPARVLELLLAVRDAQLDGSWRRLKACANDECLWAFYDRSRNRTGAWCDMSACGNKLKNRDFRARRRGGRQHSGREVPHGRGGQRTQSVE